MGIFPVALVILMCFCGDTDMTVAKISYMVIDQSRFPGTLLSETYLEDVTQVAESTWMMNAQLDGVVNLAHKLVVLTFISAYAFEVA